MNQKQFDEIPLVSQTNILPSDLSLYTCACSVAKLCLTLCDPMDYSPPGSSVRGISQARILECVAIPSPGNLPEPGMEPSSPALAGGFYTTELRGKPVAYLENKGKSHQ